MSRGVGLGADGVEVALPEFAVAARLGVLAAPDRAHVVALERRAELADVLGREAGERNGQVEAQGHVAVAVILEAVEMSYVGLVAALAEQDFGVFQGRRVDGREAVGAVDRAGPSPAAARAGSSAPADNRESPSACAVRSDRPCPYSCMRRSSTAGCARLEGRPASGSGSVSIAIAIAELLHEAAFLVGQRRHALALDFSSSSSMRCSSASRCSCSRWIFLAAAVAASAATSSAGGARGGGGSSRSRLV